MSVVEQSDSVGLDELAELAGREYELAVEAGTKAFNHALRCGRALIDAQSICPPGKWVAWLEEKRDVIGCSPMRSMQYMRLARNESLLEVEGVKSVRSGMTLLRSLPAGVELRESHKFVRRTDADRAEARRMVTDEGLTYSQVADIFEVTESTARSWLDPDYLEKARTYKQQRLARLRDAKERAKQAEYARVAKRIGGGVPECYSLIRLLAQRLDEVGRMGANPAIKAAAGDALQYVYRAEDAFVKALKDPAA